MPKPDKVQYYYDLKDIYDEILNFNVQYGDNYPRDIARAMQTILNYFDNEKHFVEKEIEQFLR